jgi:hypothetical protein
MFEDFETIVVDMGTTVICDFCDKDWSFEEGSGGFLFQSEAVCPDCEDGMMKSIKKYNEEKFIRGHCPKDKSFKQWVLDMR